VPRREEVLKTSLSRRYPKGSPVRLRPLALVSALALALTLLPLAVSAQTADDASDLEGVEFGDVESITRLLHDNPETGETDVPWIGSTEIDFDGERYAFIGQFNGRDNRAQHVEQGGMFIVDMVGDEETPQFSVVSQLWCPGTDNYIRYMDPEVYQYAEGGGEFVAMAHHGNRCSDLRHEDWHKEGMELNGDPNTTPRSGGEGFNGISIIDVSDKANPTIVSTIGHTSAHTVMPHPTEPYLFILPGGLPTNGTDAGKRAVAPTAIIDVSDPLEPVYTGRITHNASGCHDFGFNSDGSVGYCAGLGEVSTWDLSDPTSPVVLGRVHNPAIQFAHNVVISDDDKFLVINDEAFGFHTCNNNEAADLYGSMWVYDISFNPHAPVLAGRVAPPGHPNNNVNTAGWTLDWCAAHNYNFVPGTHVLVSSWFAGGITAHDISDPMNPELLVHYMPEDGVMWSGHYYGGYLITGDMLRGSEVLDVPAVRALDPTIDEDFSELSDGRSHGEERARKRGDNGRERGVTATSSVFAAPPVDMSSVLIPAVLPPRPLAPRDPQGGGFCVLPGGPRL
jgi:hypothetical protein